MKISFHMLDKYIYLCLLSCLIVGFATAQSPIPHVDFGKIERIENFPSRYIKSRNIDIWLPADYSTQKKYAVLYMHDGQMLFDAATTWNKQAWEVDSILNKIYESPDISQCIVVGIWNGGPTRHTYYFPQRPYEKMTKTEKDTVTAQLQRAGGTKEIFQPHSDDYLKFIVKELKPYIDQKYAVLTNKENTFIAGSSMGGLISMYALCEYPKIFGGAACLSTHWVGTFTLENNPIPNAFINYLNKKLPNPKNHKIYFDCGDKTLDALYPAIQKKVDTVLSGKGYTEKNWVSQYFPGDDHSEKSWKKRLHIPLTFLLQKKR